MNIRTLFRENLLLEVFEPEQQIYYKSIIQEIHDDYIGIGMPMRKQKYLSMPKDSTWEFRLIRRDNLYYFHSPCLNYHKGERVPLYHIDWPDEVRRVQRREFFRVPCAFEAHYWILKKPWERGNLPQNNFGLETEKSFIKKSFIPEKKPVALEMLAEMMGEPEEAMIGDISGGGLQIVTSKWMPIGTVLLMGLFLKGQKQDMSLFVKGRVVWVAPFQTKLKLRFRHAVEYVDIPERIQEEIVGFIFVLMRERIGET